MIEASAGKARPVAWTLLAVGSCLVVPVCLTNWAVTLSE